MAILLPRAPACKNTPRGNNWKDRLFLAELVTLNPSSFHFVRMALGGGGEVVNDAYGRSVDVVEIVLICGKTARRAVF